MAFLGSNEIVEKAEELFAEGFEKDCVQECSYDLRLGPEVYTVGKRAPETISAKFPYVSLPPGAFAILTCLELLHMPKEIMAFITLRNRYKMQGLVNVSGFHVDPTFKGRLVFAVQNVGPNDIKLKYGDRTFTIFFANVGKNDKDRKNPARTGILLEDVQQLGGNSVTLLKLKKDIDHLRTILVVYAPVAVALLIALIVTIIKLIK
jgi:dCTP deaminase